MRHHWKKLSSILIATCMAVSLAACGSSAGSSGSAAPADNKEAVSESAAGADTGAGDEAAPAEASAAPSQEAAAPAGETAAAAAEEAAAAGTGQAAADDAAGDAAADAATTAAVVADEGEPIDHVDYQVLVNKLHPLPKGWEDVIETVHMTNSIGDDVEVEKTAYEAYQQLKADLEAEGIYVDLDSAYRSVEEQQRIWDDFTQKYGDDYTRKTVAVPGYSEHHTGLALDLYLIVDGKDIVENEDLVTYPEIWEQIHQKLANYGFILRYTPGDEYITGYAYEPWHIRYVGMSEDYSTNVAMLISASGKTLEEYLHAVPVADDVTIDYGTSSVFSDDERKDAAVQVECAFATFEGCELHSLRYAGDEACTDENLAWINSISEDSGTKYTKVAEFLTDFHSPVDEEIQAAWNPDQEYKDYQWWLGQTEDGGWDIVSYGY